MADASALIAEAWVLIAAARSPATARPAGPPARWVVMNRGNTSSPRSAWPAGKAAHIAAPTSRKSANWKMTTMPLPTSARRASPSERVASSRCTMSWSVPCDAADSIAPPSSAVKNA